jgi:probable regulatory domain-containing protein
MDIVLNPIGREEIHKLESVLLFATLFRPEVLALIRDPNERLTWVDSLAVASAALAREKAGMTLSEIAEELGRTEQTIRKHLKGESKAGELVKETFELLKQGKLDNILKTVEMLENIEKEKQKIEKIKEELRKLKVEIDEKLEEMINDL